MTDNGLPEELRKLAEEASGGDAGLTAANEKVIFRFKKAELAVPLGAKERVLASLERKPAARRLAWPALAVCAAALVLVVSLRQPGRPKAEVSPDWRDYSNYPSYAEEAATYLIDMQPDWRCAEKFPGLTEDGGRL